MTSFQLTSRRWSREATARARACDSAVSAAETARRLSSWDAKIKPKSNLQWWFDDFVVVYLSCVSCLFVTLRNLNKFEPFGLTMFGHTTFFDSRSTFKGSFWSLRRANNEVTTWVWAGNKDNKGDKATGQKSTERTNIETKMQNSSSFPNETAPCHGYSWRPLRSRATPGEVMHPVPFWLLTHPLAGLPKLYWQRGCLQKELISEDLGLKFVVNTGRSLHQILHQKFNSNATALEDGPKWDLGHVRVISSFLYSWPLSFRSPPWPHLCSSLT